MVKWFRYAYPEHTIFAIPNGGRRGKIEAGIMKAEGVLSGVADLFLMYANYEHNGLFVEVKAENGKQSEAQKDFEKRATKEGYRYVTCRSIDEFVTCVNEYLK